MVCSESYGDLIPEALRNHTNHIMAHLAFKFFGWYSDRSLLKVVVGPLVRDIREAVLAAAVESSPDAAPAGLRIYSGELRKARCDERGLGVRVLLDGVHQ